MNSARKRRFLWTAKSAGIITMVIAGLVLTGWALDIAILKSISPQWVSMKVNVALAFLAAGFVLFYHLNHTGSQEKGWLATAGSVFVLLIGLITLVEYIFHWNLRIDEILIKDISLVGTNTSGRMAPLTAIAFVVLGLSLFFYDRENNVRRNANIA